MAKEILQTYTREFITIMLDSEEEIRAKIDACPDRWMREHWLICEACAPLRKMLQIRLAGFAYFEDYDIDQKKYFKICDKCSATYLASEDTCIRCHNERLRKEIRPDHPSWMSSKAFENLQ